MMGLEKSKNEVSIRSPKLVEESSEIVHDNGPKFYIGYSHLLSSVLPRRHFLTKIIIP
jgi:hypothetical protein